MTIEAHHVAPVRAGLSRNIGLIAAPLAAIVYPWALQAFNGAAVPLLTSSQQARPGLWLAAAFFLTAIFAIPLIGLFSAQRLRRIEPRSAAERRAELVALIVVATPAIYTFLGVIDYMTSSPVADEWTMAAIWAALIAFVVMGARQPSPSEQVVTPVALRISHGVAALAIIGMFLGFHLVNHLAGVLGAEAHRSLMKSVHAIYGAPFTEPVLVALMLFQVASGVLLVRRRLQGDVDVFGMFQVATGLYLAFFVLGHMNSVFIFARVWSEPPIVTDWSFATSESWGGLIASGWSNRLIPHYALGVFFVLAHIGSGLRFVAIGHGVPKLWADRALFAVLTLAFAIATAIMLGMCGVHLDFAAFSSLRAAPVHS